MTDQPALELPLFAHRCDSILQFPRFLEVEREIAALMATSTPFPSPHKKVLTRRATDQYGETVIPASLDLENRR